MAFHIGETTVSFPFSREQAEKLSGSVRGLLETFAEKQKAERPKRWSMMEYKLQGMWLARHVALYLSHLLRPDHSCGSASS